MVDKILRGKAITYIIGHVHIVMTTSSIILPTSLNLLSAQVITNVSEDITIDRQQWFMNPFCQKTTNLIYYEIFLDLYAGCTK